MEQLILIGKGDQPAPSATTAEDAAFEYFHNRATAGAYAPMPPIHKWRQADREAFVAELARLESERAQQAEMAVRAAEQLTARLLAR